MSFIAPVRVEGKFASPRACRPLESRYHRQRIGTWSARRIALHRLLRHGLLGLLVCCASTVGAAVPGPSVDGAASLRFRRLGVEQGLSQSSVWALAQDRDGFVWLGTQNGLNRFDGHEFRVYRAFAGMGNAQIRGLAVDGAGRLWVGMVGGLFRYLPERDRFERIRFDADAADRQAYDNIQLLHVDRAGTLWVGSARGVARYDAARNEFVHLPMWPALPTSSEAGAFRLLQGLLHAPDGSVWLGRVDGLWRYRPETGDYRRLPLPGDVAAISALLYDRHGRVWIGTGQGLFRYDPAAARFDMARHDPNDPHSLGEDSIASLFEDAAGRVFIGFGGKGGVDRIIGEAPLRFEHYLYRRHDPGALGSGRVLAMLQDVSGTLWFGTNDDGASLHHPLQHRFRSYGPDHAASAALANSVVNGLAAAGKHALWVGSYSGLYQFDLVDERLQALPAAAVEVRGLLATPERLWIGGSEGIWRLDRAQLERLQPLSGTSAAGFGFRPVWLEQGRLWVNARGLQLYDAASGALLGRSEASVGSLLALDDAHLLGTGRDTLSWISRRDGRLLYQLEADPSGQGSLPLGNYVDVARGADGRVWLATYGAGLVEMRLGDPADPASARFRVLDEADGLADNGINALQSDGRGRLWLATDAGISRFDPASGEFRNYNGRDGTFDRAYLWRARARLDSGLMAFGAREGFTVFDPEHLPELPPPPAPKIVQLALDNQPLLVDPDQPTALLRAQPQHLSELTLPAAQARDLAIRFAAPWSIAPQGLRYARKLEGFDGDWIETDASHREAHYTNLAPGTYRLRLRARNHDGVWSAAETELRLILLPAWWQTDLAKIGAALGVLGLLYAAYALRMRQLALQRRRLERLVEARTQELTASMQRERESEQVLLRERLASATLLTAGLAHEINNPANFIGIAAQNLEAQLQQLREFLLLLAGEDADPDVIAAIEARLTPPCEQAQTIQEGVQRIRGIVTDLRTFSRPDAEQMTPTRLGELLRATLNLVGARYRKQVRFVLELHDDPPLPCFPSRLNQVFINLVINACHAIEARAVQSGADYQGELTVTVERSQSGVAVSFVDNGSGIPETIGARIFEPFFTTKPAGKGTGLGLPVSKRLVEEHGGRIEVDSVVGAGSRFVVWLPLPADAGENLVAPDREQHLAGDRVGAASP